MKKIITVLLAALTIISSGAIAASAAQTDLPSASAFAVKPGDDPQSDKIIKKWRNNDGVWQYRRWNDTKHCWVDPHWITP